jgi:hypothetical protein
VAKPSKSLKTEFKETIRLIRETKLGQEAAMYGPLRDLFCDVLGYPKGAVLIDIAGDAGRPDVTYSELGWHFSLTLAVLKEIGFRLGLLRDSQRYR